MFTKSASLVYSAYKCGHPMLLTVVVRIAHMDPNTFVLPFPSSFIIHGISFPSTSSPFSFIVRV